MASLTAWKFDTPDGAEQALKTVEDLAKQQLIVVQDAAVVSWPQGKKKPKTRQAQSLAAAGALGGAFWGMLFGLLFLVPFFGMAMGAAMGALAGHFSDYGISDDFIKQVRAKGHGRYLCALPVDRAGHHRQGGGCVQGHQDGVDPVQSVPRAGSATQGRVRRGVALPRSTC
ncbi:MAG: DUF1269 domain-containing protein [Caldilineaceae bacterium]